MSSSRVVATHRFFPAVVLVPMLLAFAGPAAGQFGIRGGVNLTKFVGGDAVDVESATGLNLGMSVPLISIGPISLVPEVYYAQKGARQTDPLVGTFEFDLSYIEVPVLARLTIPLNASRSLSAYVAGGPAFAWNVDCSFSATGVGAGAASACGETFGTFDTAMEKADRGIVGSGGLMFTLGGLGGVNLDARVVRGLTRLREGEAGGDIRNQAFSLMLGYYLGR